MHLAAIEDWKERARRVLPQFAFEYLECGVEDGRTLRNNVEAFEHIKFDPRVLVDVSNIDTSTTVCGDQIAMPIAVGPTGLNGLFRHGADEMLARASGKAGVPFVLSTMSTSPIERVREATAGPLWLQLYVQNDLRIAERLMRNAEELGFSTLLLTVDTPVAGKRDHYMRNGFKFAEPLRISPRLIWDVLTHPRWVMSTAVYGVPQMVNLAVASEAAANFDKQVRTVSQEMNRSLTWDHLGWIRRHWRGPVIVKGIASMADARLAHQYGADGIVISNHGGRQLEDSPTAIELLPNIADTFGQSLEILIDGGVRRGSAIVKAMALGASGVLLGRAPLYGLAADGEAGVSDVLAILRNEFEITLRLIGRTSIEALDTSCTKALPQMQPA
jgi:(S)-mandelate dehydrogenase